MNGSFNFDNKEMCKRLIQENGLKNFSYVCFVLFFVTGSLLVPFLIWFEFILGFVVFCYFFVVCSIMYYSAIKHKNASRILYGKDVSLKELKQIKQFMREGGRNEN